MSRLPEQLSTKTGEAQTALTATSSRPASAPRGTRSWWRKAPCPCAPPRQTPTGRKSFAVPSRPWLPSTPSGCRPSASCAPTSGAASSPSSPPMPDTEGEVMQGGGGGCGCCARGGVAGVGCGGGVKPRGRAGRCQCVGFENRSLVLRVVPERAGSDRVAYGAAHQ